MKVLVSSGCFYKHGWAPTGRGEWESFVREVGADGIEWDLSHSSRVVDDLDGIRNHADFESSLHPLEFPEVSHLDEIFEDLGSAFTAKSLLPLTIHTPRRSRTEDWAEAMMTTRMSIEGFHAKSQVNVALEYLPALSPVESEEWITSSPFLPLLPHVDLCAWLSAPRLLGVGLCIDVCHLARTMSQNAVLFGMSENRTYFETLFESSLSSLLPQMNPLSWHMSDWAPQSQHCVLGNRFLPWSSILSTIRNLALNSIFILELENGLPANKNEVIYSIRKQVELIRGGFEE
jgi:hypothetical protein